MITLRDFMEKMAEVIREHPEMADMPVLTCKTEYGEGFFDEPSWDIDEHFVDFYDSEGKRDTRKVRAVTL